MQITAVGNLGQISGYNTRIWKKHGRLPWVDYATAAPAKNGEIIVNGKRYPIDRLLVGGKNYFAIREIVEVLNAAGVCNLTVGNKGSVAELETKNEREKPRDGESLGFLIGCDHVFRMFATVKVMRRHKKKRTIGMIVLFWRGRRDLNSRALFRRLLP